MRGVNDMKEKFETTLKHLKEYGQEHILNNYESLSQENKEKLLNQILTIDLNQSKNIY